MVWLLSVFWDVKTLSHPFTRSQLKIIIYLTIIL